MSEVPLADYFTMEELSSRTPEVRNNGFPYQGTSEFELKVKEWSGKKWVRIVV